MIIRFLTPNDIVAHDKITAQAFSYSCDIHDPQSVLPCEKVLGAFDEDNRTLLADLEIQERKCYYDGGLLTCAAVGGVAAKPEHRGKGAVKALFRYLFEEAKCDISILYPFSEAYYRKLGYERAGNSVCAVVPFSELSNIRRNHDVVLYEGTGTDRLLALYNRCARNYNLCFVRENADAFPADPYLSQKFTYIWKDNAFATISVDREKSVVSVHELYFDSCESMLGIVGFLRNFEANQKSVCFEKIPDDSPLIGFLQDLEHCDLRIRNTGAARILHPENVLKAHRYPQDGAFTLRICDEVFGVSVSKDGVAVEKNCLRAPDVTMNIAAASKILLSGITNEAFVPDIVIHNPGSDFFRLFPPKTSFFSDAI